MTSENKANKYKAIYKRIKLIKVGKKYQCLLFKRVSKLPRKLAYKNYYSETEIYK